MQCGKGGKRGQEVHLTIIKYEVQALHSGKVGDVRVGCNLIALLFDHSKLREYTHYQHVHHILYLNNNLKRRLVLWGPYDDLPAIIFILCANDNLVFLKNKKDRPCYLHQYQQLSDLHCSDLLCVTVSSRCPLG